MGKINWCGYEWSNEMEGGRIIHPKYPYAWYGCDENVVKINKNNELELTYVENPIEIHHWGHETYNPTIERALIRTTTPFDYGTFSAEAICPKGLNLCCAFWLSGDGNWPPEIDILEAWSEDNNYSHKTLNHFPWLCSSWRTTYNVHYNNKKMVHEHLGSKNIAKYDQPLDPTENWIKYECIWEPDKITFKANNVVTKTVCKKYANMLVNNLGNPEKGHLMDVIFDINIDDPKIIPNRLDTPFKIRNFKYKPLK